MGCSSESLHFKRLSNAPEVCKECKHFFWTDFSDLWCCVCQCDAESDFECFNFEPSEED